MGEADAVQPEGQPSEPQFTNGTIIFHCPRGHRLVVAAKHAGKRGRCDKKNCGAPVTIPVPPLEAPMPGDTPGVALEPLAPAPATTVEAMRPEAATGAVPTEPDATAMEAAAGEREDIASGGWDFINQSDAAGEGTEAGSSGAADGRSTTPRDAASENPTARLVARLWAERDHGGIVELHLVSGSVLLPEWYESRESRGAYGLFASQAPDGTVTLTAVRWDAIQKVVVRQVRDLPDGMFD